MAHEFCTYFSNIRFSRHTQIIVSYFMHDEGKLVKGYSSKKTLDAAKHVTRCNLGEVKLETMLAIGFDCSGSYSAGNAQAS